MASVPENDLSGTPWSTAVKLLSRWLENNERADALLETLPKTYTGQDRSRTQSLLFGAIRHYGRIRAHIQKLVTRPPRPRLEAVLLVAGFEILEGGDEHHLARVVHHAVEQSKTLASPAEARLVNAVVRKLGAVLAAETEPPKLATADVLAAYYSHPEWLVNRWLAQFGAPATRSLLEWNQQPAVFYARWRRTDREPSEEEKTFLAPTEWKNYFEVKPGHWPEVTRLIDDGSVYLQDPSTRVPVELLAPRPGESILDACAAPGGKSVALGDMLTVKGSATSGRIVAVDIPGKRIDRLKENLGRVRGVDVALVQADLKEAVKILKLHDLPTQYSAVLVDVPCSNTGVMRHRVDVKWRLQENDFPKHARQQLELLNAAARLVAPKGRLVYSTCSLDAEENDRVVAAFIERWKGAYKLAHSQVSTPWDARHDGAAAFLIERVG